MKTQTKTMIMKVILMVCLIGGCSKTSQMTTQNNLEPRNDEPFMATIKELATKREGFYFSVWPFDEAEIERMKSDINYLQDSGALASEPRGHFEGIPILMIRF